MSFGAHFINIVVLINLVTPPWWNILNRHYPGYDLFYSGISPVNVGCAYPVPFGFAKCFVNLS
jgi:hypothetical protein